MPETTEPQLTESDVNDFESSLLLAVDGKAMVRVNFAAAVIRDWRAMKAENERQREQYKDLDADYADEVKENAALREQLAQVTTERDKLRRIAKEEGR